jgi:hypothetical protein
MSRPLPRPRFLWQRSPMTDETKIPDPARAIAEQQGLQRALKLFPDGVKAAADRGLRPLGAPPAGTSPIASPAPVFDPTRYERNP